MMQGVVDAFTSIARTERLPGLFRGLGPTLLTNAPFSALYYMFYKELQTRLTRVRGLNPSKPSPQHALPQHCIAPASSIDAGWALGLLCPDWRHSGPTAPPNPCPNPKYTLSV